VHDSQPVVVYRPSEPSAPRDMHTKRRLTRGESRLHNPTTESEAKPLAGRPGSIMRLMSSVRGFRAGRVGCICLMIALAGCGGSSSADGGGTHAFAQSADRICAGYYKSIYSMAGPVGEAQVQHFITREQIVRDTELRELQALSPPIVLASGYKQYLQNISTVNGLFATLAHGMTTGHPGNQQVTKRAERLQAVDYKEADALGLSECAKNPYTATHHYGDG
jgi:hypothetical protein